MQRKPLSVTPCLSDETARHTTLNASQVLNKPRPGTPEYAKAKQSGDEQKNYGRVVDPYANVIPENVEGQAGQVDSRNDPVYEAI